MASRKNRRQSESNQPAVRRGSLLIEAGVSLLLLGTAAVALTKLARGSVELQHQSDAAFASALAAENVRERLTALSDSEFDSESDADFSGITESVSKSSGCSVNVTKNAFSAGAVGGVHLVIEVGHPPDTRVVLDSWRFSNSNVEGRESSDAESTQEGSSESKSSNDVSGKDDVSNEETSKEVE